MGHLRTIRSWLLGSTLVLPVAVTWCSAPVTYAQRPVTDPVEELRQALKREPLKTPAGLEFRRQDLTEHVKALKTIGDFRRALQLQAAWKDESGDPDVAKIDVPLRMYVAEKFRQGLQDAMRSGGVAGQIAATELLEDIGSTIQDSGKSRRGIA